MEDDPDTKDVDESEGCFNQDCPDRMLRYLQEQTPATAAEAMSNGQVTYWNFDVREGETYYDFPACRRDITGSFAYSFDMGEFNFIQLHNYPGYGVQFASYNIGQASMGIFSVTPSYNWLRRELQKARGRGKRSILNYHDHLERHKDEVGTKINTWTDQKFLNAIHDMNVEAIFVAHLHSWKGYQDSYKVPSYYGPRGGTYDIPVYQTSNPIYGFLLLVNFPSGAPIEVAMLDLTGHQHPAPITAVSASQFIPQDGELLVAPPYSCDDGVDDVRREQLPLLPTFLNHRSSSPLGVGRGFLSL